MTQRYSYYDEGATQQRQWQKVHLDYSDTASSVGLILHLDHQRDVMLSTMTVVVYQSDSFACPSAWRSVGGAGCAAQAKQFKLGVARPTETVMIVINR
ncbi:hypothetical protein MRX96_041651 [Rhipicephalus microplus]